MAKISSNIEWIEYCPIPVCVVNCESGRIIGVNNIFLQAFDQELALEGYIWEVDSRENRNLYAPGCRQQEFAQQYLAQDFEYINTRFQSNWWSREQSFVKLDNVLHMVVMFNRRTASKLLEEQLREYASYPLDDPDPIMRIESNGMVLFANNAALQLDSGWSAEVGDFVPERIMGSVRRAKTLGVVQVLEEQVGDDVVQYNVVPIARESYVHLYGRNITEIRRAEKQLTIARDKALQASRSKSEFLATMGHEIRTPLHVVLGLADILANTELTSEQDEYLRTILRAGKLLGKLIDDVMDLSKIEAGNMMIGQELFGLPELVLDIAETFKVVAEEKGLAFDIQIDSNVPETTRGDPLRLRQILVNLIGNAIKFTDTGGVRIRIVFEPCDARLVRIVVEDTGIGIAKEDQQRIFNKFEQADSSITTRFGGSGMGLAIAISLAHHMGGDILLKSEFGQGSAFCLELPLTEFTEEEIAPSPSLPEPNVQPPTGDDFSILAVDDSPENLKLLAIYLRKSSFHLKTVDSGEKALQQLKQNEYDLVLLDMRMPNMDGYEVVRRLRAREEQEGLLRHTVYALSANSLHSEKEKAFEAGCDGYLTKPMTKHELLDVVRTVMETQTKVSGTASSTSESLLEDTEHPPGVELDPELIDLIPGFLHNREKDIATFRQLLLDENWTEIEALGHKMKGVSGGYGFHLLGEFAAGIESAAKSKSRGDLDATLTDAHNHLEEVKRFFSAGIM